MTACRANSGHVNTWQPRAVATRKRVTWWSLVKVARARALMAARNVHYNRAKQPFESRCAVEASMGASTEQVAAALWRNNINAYDCVRACVGSRARTLSRSTARDTWRRRRKRRADAAARAHYIR